MALIIGDNFSYKARKPLDERLAFDTVANMAAMPDSVLYTGLLAYNLETSRFYVFNSTNTVDATTGKWRLFSGGSGSSSFTAAVDATPGSPTEGHLILTFADSSTQDCGYVLGSNVATITPYAASTAYKEGDLVYHGDQLARVTADYTTGAVVTDLTALFRSDTGIVIMSHNKIDDSAAYPNKTYSSQKIEQLIQGASNSFAGSVKTEDASDLPASPNAGTWCLIADCTISAPGQAGIGSFNGTTWDIYPIPQGTFTFPEPLDDGKNYFRSRSAGMTSGDWVQFTGVDGSDVMLKVNVLDSSDTTDGAYIPPVGELVWDSDRNALIMGDGSTTLLNLQPFYSKTLSATDITGALTYTPENVANKGQANGYAPLDASGKVPAANLPAALTDVYSKSETDSKDSATLVSATALVNTEATTARANETQIANDLSAHTTNTAIHVTQTEKDAWNAKVDATALNPFSTHVANTVIHVTQADKDKWDGMNKAYFVTAVANLPTTDNQVGNVGYVQTSAAGVTPITVDQYIWDGTAWQKIDGGAAGTTLTLDWGNIQNKPTSPVLAIDNSVAIAHSHTNSAALAKIGQTSTGVFTYDGKEIGIRCVFVPDKDSLPATGTTDTLYVVYEDSRVRNYPSISVWKDNSYQVLGCGTQDAPAQVEDLSILQNEYFSVAANSKHRITVTQNQYFAFLPVEILKEVPGLTDQIRTITDFTDSSKFEYDANFVSLNSNHMRVGLNDIPMTFDSVSSQYFHYVDVDLTNYKNVGGIE